MYQPHVIVWLSSKALTLTPAALPWPACAKSCCYVGNFEGSSGAASGVLEAAQGTALVKLHRALFQNPKKPPAASLCQERRSEGLCRAGQSEGAGEGCCAGRARGGAGQGARQARPRCAAAGGSLPAGLPRAAIPGGAVLQLWAAQVPQYLNPNPSLRAYSADRSSWSRWPAGRPSGVGALLKDHAITTVLHGADSPPPPLPAHIEPLIICWQTQATFRARGPRVLRADLSRSALIQVQRMCQAPKASCCPCIHPCSRPQHSMLCMQDTAEHCSRPCSASWNSSFVGSSAAQVWGP